MAQNGLSIPKGFNLLKGQTLDYSKVNFPCVVKPNNTENSLGKSIISKSQSLIRFLHSRISYIGINLVRSKDDIKKAISIAFEHSDTIIIEDFIEGREFRCSVIEKCDDGKIEVIAMPPMEYLIDTKGIRDAGQKILVDEHGLPVGECNKKNW